MSRQQADGAGQQIERPEESLQDEQRDQSRDNLQQVGGQETRERGRARDSNENEVREGSDNPKRVQYGHGFSKDHPAQPGTDKNLAPGVDPSGRAIGKKERPSS